nr:uncharacterized protein LOC107452376 [Parasteatoda tepidariorum]
MHHAVFKPTSPTTPVRPAFDASCKSKGNISLNDCLMKCPNLLKDIPTALLRFRQKKIGVVADIKKALLQISVAEEDRKVVFGLNCSPLLLGAVLRHHLDSFAFSPYQDVSETLKSAYYVDNCVTSVNSENELQRFVKVSTEIMAKGKLELRGWEYSAVKRLSVPMVPSQVLGLLWDKNEDVILCDTQSISNHPEKITRRSILSMAQQVFDPLGFSCLATLYPMLLLQESWRSELGWDTEVCEDTKLIVLNWIGEMRKLKDLKIKRQVFPDNYLESELHTFCDASGLSYAAVVYLRCETDENTSVQLLMAKSRVAPLKKISISRLELLACCIATRLADLVRRSLKINLKQFFWTDSTTALQWIQRKESWGVFVRNRVKEILKTSTKESWRHIPGDYNPADLPSRGCSVEKLIKSRWWEGPHWPRTPVGSWPSTEMRTNEEEVRLEIHNCSTLLLIENSEDFLYYFSTYTRIIRMMSWILRFIHNSRDKTNFRKGELSVKELDEAERVSIKRMQGEVFTPQFINSLKTLNVFTDENGINRVKTKLIDRKDTDLFRYPYLLPSKHKFVEVLIRENHLELMHAGLQTVLSNLREKFWVLGGRRSVRHVINKCIKCRRRTVKPVETAPISLPEDRVKNASVLEIVGVDLAGPLILKGGQKSWLVLFTCAVFRAVHLELVSSLSTKDFLLCLRRFIARRGRPSVVYSDNGTNFVGAENLFRSIDWSVVESETTVKRIVWKFIPPSAAW